MNEITKWIISASIVLTVMGGIVAGCVWTEWVIVGAAVLAVSACLTVLVKVIIWRD